MRTTVRLDEGLLELARREAASRNTTLTALIEQGLRFVLRKPGTPAPGKRVSLPVSKARGGVMPGVDLNDTSSLLDRMDDLA
jgi:hypothetical protein